MTACCTTSKCCNTAPATKTYTRVSAVNTLAFDGNACIHCGMCSVVCPHGVFAMEQRRMQVVRAEACMECGACMRNCPVSALYVDSGVGCAAAMINAALTGKAEATCGGPEPRCC